jgi:hypothetical protein
MNRIVYSFCLLLSISCTTAYHSWKLVSHNQLRNSNALFNAKEELLNELDGKTSPMLVSPETLAELKKVNRYYGFTKESYYVDSTNKKTYRDIPELYIDLTIKSESDKPIWQRSVNELIGQGFFQNPFISTAYERGYRDNFKGIISN